MGLPASGKSTFSKQLCEKLPKSDIQTILVSYDEIIPLDRQRQLANNTDSLVWKSERKAILENVECLLSGAKVSSSSLCSTAIDRTEKQVLIIIDDNNYYSSMRYEYYQLARKFEIGFCQLYFDVPVDGALKRNSERTGETKISDEVITKMAGKLEPPNPHSNVWEQFSFQLPMMQDGFDGPTLEMCNTVINLALSNPVKPIEDKTEERELSRAKCTASVVHQADKSLRKMVSTKIKDVKAASVELPTSKEELQTKATLLNSVKDELLEDLKTGFTTLPKEVVHGIGQKQATALTSLDSIMRDLFELKLSTPNK
jgi:O-phosphoseryl-tRNA(Sec) kinase